MTAGYAAREAVKDEHAFRGSWRRAGLILRPVGVTAWDRFGDVMLREKA